MIRYIFLTVEVLLLIVFSIPLFSGILNPGNAAGIIVSVTLIFMTIFFKKFCGFIADSFKNTGGRVLIIASAVILGIAVIYVSVLSGLMVHAQLRSDDSAGAVVVLGCKVNGTRPSRMLRRRLDSAFDYLKGHPDAVCVVSGGQGSDEMISEALAMKNYLVEKGVSENKIIMEGNSTNTDENLKFSSEILKAMGIDSAAVVTDGFHQYRASLTAKKYGMSSSAVNAETDFFTKWLIPTYWVREWMALTKELFV